MSGLCKMQNAGLGAWRIRKNAIAHSRCGAAGLNGSSVEAAASLSGASAMGPGSPDHNDRGRRPSISVEFSDQEPSSPWQRDERVASRSTQAKAVVEASSRRSRRRSRMNASLNAPTILSIWRSHRWKSEKFSPSGEPGRPSLRSPPAVRRACEPGCSSRVPQAVPGDGCSGQLFSHRAAEQDGVAASIRPGTL